jgi:isocitrate lyase
MARGTEVDTNERITSRVLQQLQTIYMLLQWNEENRSAEIATTAVAAAQLQAAVEDTAVPVVAPHDAGIGRALS